MSRGNEDAQQLNQALVSQIESSGALSDAAVIQAFRAILRHHFLPGRPLDEVYEDSAVMTKMGDRGVPISSSSQPAIMAVMLQQLRLKRGQRVLEIGAGTGYNAALIAQLVGRTGEVVTVDIDRELCDQARANLASAGVDGVKVVQGDGAEGWAASAPYDRIILTVSTTDLSPAWTSQLAEDGVLVVPLALAGPVQQSVAFVRRQTALVSAEIASCGFMPLRGQMAPPPPADADELAGLLQESGRPSGHTIAAADLRAGFETWLALTDNAYVRAEPGFGLQLKKGAALVSGNGGGYAVTIYGQGDAAAEALVAAHRAWGQRRPPVDRLIIEAHPNRGASLPSNGYLRVLKREHFTFVIKER